MMNKWPKRIFIAISLPENVKSRLGAFQKERPTLPCNWVPAENLHITLAFLGNTGEKELEKIEQIVQGIAQKHQPFNVSLKKICYGPPKITPPSLVWAEGEKCKEFADLKIDLDDLLAQATGFSASRRKYIPHITLGRIKKFKWRRYNSENRPRIDKDIDLVFQASSIEIMESELKRTGAEYKVLRTFEL